MRRLPTRAPALAAVFFTLAVTGIHAQVPTVTDVTREDLRYRVGVLSDDSMLGRDAGQIGNVRATDYVARELKRLGLAAAGEDGYFQTIPLVSRAPMRNETLEVGGAAIANGVVSSRAIGGAPFGGVFNGSDVPTVYGGAIGAGELIKPEDARGKVVIFQAPLNGNGAVGNAYVGAAGTLASYADAAAILLIGLDRMSPQAVNGLRAARIVLADIPPGVRVTPGALITTDAAVAIFGVAPTAGGVAIGTRGKPITAHFGMADMPSPSPARNVIAILRGTDAKLRNEFVAIGAHTDHVGIGRPVDHDSVRAANEVLRPMGANGQPRAATPEDLERIRQIRVNLARDHAPRLDSIFNGADDDASGTAVALELAEYYAKHPTKRSLLFVFHTAEEKGLFGAAYYTDHPTVNRDSIVMQLNMDQLSRGGPDDLAGSTANTLYLLGTRRLSTQLGDLVERINARPNHRMNLDYTLDQPGHPANGYCRSDHYMYARYGIPIVFFTAGWHRDYHMVTDEVQYTNPTTMRNIASLANDLVASVANAAQRPLVDHEKPNPRGTCTQ
jgi:hypothetical protein